MTLALDGSASAIQNSGTTATPSLTTTNANDIIIVGVAIVSTGNALGSTHTVSSISSSGLTWIKRKTYTNSNNVTIEEWYAIASTPLSAESITVTISSTGTFTALAFGISGADTSNPFDVNASLPATATGTSGTATVDINTSNADDFIIGLVAYGGAGIAGTSLTSTMGLGYTNIVKTTTTEGKISGKQQNNVLGDTEYQIVSAAESNFTVDFTVSGGSAWAIIADSIIQASAPPPSTVILPSSVTAPAVRLMRPSSHGG